MTWGFKSLRPHHTLSIKPAKYAGFFVFQRVVSSTSDWKILQGIEAVLISHNTITRVRDGRAKIGVGSERARH